MLKYNQFDDKLQALYGKFRLCGGDKATRLDCAAF